MPLQFAWQDITADFSEFDAGQGYDRNMPYMCGICVFLSSGYCRILHQDVWPIEMDLCLDLELGTGNYVRAFPLKFGPNENKFCLARIELQLIPCHPGRYSQ